MFDLSFLPSAQLEFVVLADTHYMLDPGDRPVEFESRRKQTARAEAALKLAAALRPAFAVHLGDLVQEYPETERFREAFDQARQQLDRCGIKPHHVAGNQDIGDKPDGTMPTRPVTPESLASYHALYGPSWYSFDHSGCHFIVLNTQILNTELPEARAQQAWLEGDLEAHRGKRTFIFLHLPPFLYDEEEAGLGNYDNIGQPDRRRLLDLVRQYKIESLSAAHVHFAFFNRIGATRFYNTPSTSFTRPGFSHLFTGPPPPEQGRDDADKLGFYLHRVLPGRTDVHFIRTGGALALPQNGADRLVTRTPAGLPHSPLGLTLLHPLAPGVEIPVAYPSVIRQRVRNDYPFLACLELGAPAVRVPRADLDDPLQRGRLSALRDEGVRVTAFHLWSSHPDFPALVERHLGRVDAWEVQVPGAPWPSDALLRDLKACRERTEIALSPTVPKEEYHPGKQHPRTRIGYRPDELPGLDRRLADAGLSIDRVLCRLTGAPWAVVDEICALPPLDRIGAVDLSIDFASLDDNQNACRAAEACLALACLPGSRVYFEPFIDLDRTMDVSHGLLDTRCNPRAPFHTLRCLNTVLYSDPLPNLQPTAAEIADARLRALTGPGCAYVLLASERGGPLPANDLPLADLLPSGEVRLYRLREGTVQAGDLQTIRKALSAPDLSTPVLLAARR